MIDSQGRGEPIRGRLAPASLRATPCSINHSPAVASLAE
ncbi:hypothetical protein JCM19232_1000 [Vibrio ishigakensis]|uniref:Uncharacterized protein n=1 Tax=Vibrio ishigakensis TaxID=1481914 RepID=A0A0B8PBZ8_9VIBR|nr:hypothetical protein JCM19232_1000 [Vibrio ishigakensis]GAM76115.1 hypothetical protein JCM19241_413 [Vibrio ishigakensis]